jgi:hypothetical protein
MRVNVQDAAQRALQVYLQNEFDAFFTGSDRCIVSEEFPPPDQGLPKRAVSVIPAGARQDMHFTERDVSRVDYPDASPMSLYTWRVAACRQPIQLDVWATAAASRGELCALLDDFLHKGPRYTLGTPNGEVVRDGVLLKLDPAQGGFDGFADFTFDGPALTDTSRSAREREYRATIAGFIDVDLTTQAPSPRIANIKLRMALSATGAGDPVAAPDLTLTTTRSGSVAVVSGT